jgi:hypothetical protein
VDPSKIQTIPNILQKYNGQEAKLFASLAKKYPQAAHLLNDSGGGGGGMGGGMGGGGGGFGGGAQRKLGFTKTPSPQRGGFGGGMGGNTSFGNKNPGFGGNSFSQARK